MTPRGKYDMELAEDFLTLRGQSYSYKIPYTQISRLFLLPRPGQTSISFVISVDPPIRQGKTGYQHLITQLPAEHETSVTLNLSAAEIEEKYPGKLEKEMTGFTYEILTKVFKVLSKSACRFRRDSAAHVVTVAYDVQLETRRACSMF